LKDLGFKSSDIDSLVEGTIPQQRVLALAPTLNKELEAEKAELRTWSLGFEPSCNFRLVGYVHTYS
jgi:hypothetical protein